MIETERLRMRPWLGRDQTPMLALGMDPRVMRYLGPLMNITDVVTFIEKMIAAQKAQGHCFWALETREDAVLVGVCGLMRGPSGTPISGKLEIGWRLDHRYWGAGFASEAAAAALNWAWENTPDQAVWAITARENMRSRRVMERIGMHWRTNMEFDHPALKVGDPLRRHSTYVIERPEFTA